MNLKPQGRKQYQKNKQVSKSAIFGDNDGERQAAGKKTGYKRRGEGINLASESGTFHVNQSGIQPNGIQERLPQRRAGRQSK